MGPGRPLAGRGMSNRSPDDHDEGAQCPDRSWVEQELAGLRHELANEVRTRRLRIAGDQGPGVLIEATERVASILVETADGAVGAELMASEDEGDRYAAMSLSVGGDVVAVLSVLGAEGGGQAVTRLVFDRPGTSEPWIVVDAEGIHREE